MSGADISASESGADIPASEYVAYTPSSDFIETLRTHKSSYDSMIGYNLGIAVKEEILLFQTPTKKYLLDRTFDALFHADQFICSYLNLQFQDIDRETRTLYSQEKPFKVETIFIPLGWLAEVDKETSKQRTTHYVVLWNITTEPSSLWIVFDYESLDEFSELGKNDLNNLGLHNRMTFLQEHRWYETPYTIDTALGISEDALISASNGTHHVPHDHVISHGDGKESARLGSVRERTPPEPSDSLTTSTSPATSNNPQTSQDTTQTGASSVHSENQEGKPEQQSKSLDSQGSEGVDRLTIEDQEKQMISSQQGPHKGQEGGGDNKYKDDDEETDSKTEAVDPWGEEWDAAFSFLGSSDPFDLACISLDITRWKVGDGIDVDHVERCLKKRHLLGPTLRATYAARGRDGGENAHEHRKVLET